MPAYEEWRINTEAASGPSEFVLVSGVTKETFRSYISPAMQFHNVLEGWCIAGKPTNLASFLIRRIYAPDLPVDTLALLAAYAIRTASELDSSCMQGLDIAIYRDSTRRFEFEDPSPYWEKAAALDQKIRDCFAAPVTPIPANLGSGLL